MRNHLMTGLMVLGMAMTTVACSDDGDGGGGNFSSGVSGTKKVGELSPTEVKTFCDAAEKTLTSDGFRAPTCKLLAVVAAASAGEGDLKTPCKMAYDECIKEPSDDSAMCEAPPSTCTATVGEIEACLNDTQKLLNTIAGKLPSCDNLTQSSLEMLDEDSFDFDEPASCKSVQAKCPGYIDDADEDSGDLDE